VIALVRDGAVVLDVRCVRDTDALADAVGRASERATAQKGARLIETTEGGPEPLQVADRMGDPLDTEV